MGTDDEIVDQIVSVHRDTTWTPPLHMFFLMTFMGLFMMLPGDFQAMAFEELFTVASIVVHYITNHVLFGTLDLMGTGVGEDDVDNGMMEFLELLCICVILGLAYLPILGRVLLQRRARSGSALLQGLREAVL